MTISREHRPQVVWLTTLAITIALLVWLLPRGLGSYWGSHMIANSYLPQLGLTGQAALVDPGSVRAYVALHFVISTLTGAGPRGVLDVLALTNVLTVSLMYFLISRSFTSNLRGIALLSAYIPFVLYGQVAFLTGYILGPALALSLIVIWCLLRLMQSPDRAVSVFVILAVAWLGLGPLWHSMQIMTLLVACCFTPVVYLQTREPSVLPQSRTVVYMALVAGLTWLYMRPGVLEGVLTTQPGRMDLAAMLGKGNYAGPNEYHSQSPFAWSATARYASYLSAYLLITWVAFRFLRSLKFCRGPYLKSVPVALLTAVLFADLLFQSTYFLVTGSMAPGVLLFYGIPLLLLVVATTSPEAAFGVLARWRIHNVALVIITVGVGITAVDVQYRYQTEDVDNYSGLDDYAPSHQWASTNLVSANVYSDSATSGHYQVLTAISEHHTDRLMAASIDRLLYERLTEGRDTGQPAMPLVVNDRLWEQHLAFGSLQSWNRFEPLCIGYVTDLHGLAQLYSDGAVSILDGVGTPMHK